MFNTESPSFDIVIDYQDSPALDPEHDYAESQKLSIELGKVKDKILKLPTPQVYRDYFIALLAGTEQMVDLTELHPPLPRQLQLARTMLHSIEESLDTFIKTLKYTEKNKNSLAAQHLDEDLRNEMCQRIEEHYQEAVVALQKLESFVPSTASLQMIIEKYKKRLEEISSTLEKLKTNTRSPFIFSKEVKMIELKISGLTYEIYQNHELEQEMESLNKEPLPQKPPRISRFGTKMPDEKNS